MGKRVELLSDVSAELRGCKRRSNSNVLKTITCCLYISVKDLVRLENLNASSI